jgi:hypothetical protein
MCTAHWHWKGNLLAVVLLNIATQVIVQYLIHICQNDPEWSDMAQWKLDMMWMGGLKFVLWWILWLCIKNVLRRQNRALRRDIYFMNPIILCVLNLITAKEFVGECNRMMNVVPNLLYLHSHFHAVFIALQATILIVNFWVAVIIA